MRKKVFTGISAVIIGAVLLLSGCGNSVSDEELALRQQAETAAYDLVKGKLTSSPDNLAVTAYEINAPEEFEFVEMEGETYVIGGSYAFTYGFSQQQPILAVTVEADFAVKQNEQGEWSLAEIRPSKIESDGEKERDGWTNSIDDSSCVPFISDKALEEKQLNPALDITRIAQELVYKLMLELNSYDGEKETFMLLHSQSPEHSLEKIEVPAGKDAIAVWKFRGNITGNYIGYIKGLGYAGPLLQSGFALEEQSLHQEPLYLVTRADGYYLETSGVFSSRVKGQAVDVTEEHHD